MRLKGNNMVLAHHRSALSLVIYFKFYFVLSFQFFIDNVKYRRMIVALYKKLTNTGPVFYSVIR